MLFHRIGNAPYSQPFEGVFSCQYHRSSTPFQLQQQAFPGTPTTPTAHHLLQSKSHQKRSVRLPNKSSRIIQTLCWNSNARPSSTNLYVLKNPLEQLLGETCVSAAVPTTKCSSPLRAENGTMANENAASLSSRWMTLMVLASMGSIMRIHEPHVPAAALGRPNWSGGRLITSSSIFLPCWR